MLTIRARLTYQFVVLVTVILLFFSLGVYFFSRLYLEKRFYKRLQDRAITTTTLLFELQATDTTVLKLVDRSNREPLVNEHISVYNEKLKRIIFSTNLANASFHEQFVPRLKGGQQTEYFRSGDYRILAIHLTNKGQRNWVMVSGVDQIGREALDDLRKILLVMTLAGILLLSVSGWVFADRALAPMAGIIQQVNTIFPANVQQRVQHPNRSDEIGLLVATFNRLLDRIEQALTTQKMFIANVSHELKNPLTRIQSQIDTTLTRKRDADTYEKVLQSLQEDSYSLGRLNNTLLELANIVVSANSLKMSPVRVDELLWEVKEQIQKWHEACQIQIQFTDYPEEEDALLMRGNRSALHILFLNLLDNACKFSPDKTARIDFKALNGQLIVAISNEGPPIPEADRPYIFEPFYRSNATARSAKGHGMGLALVAQISELHHGTISVNSTPVDTTFTITFPTISAL